jgi:exonuclease SbcC
VSVIDKVTIQNFQAHERLVVNLDPHITTITGPSDTGKSSIIRALRWVALNKPRGDSFIRHGAKWARVKVTVDGEVVQRRRGSKNLYKINDSVYESRLS